MRIEIQRAANGVILKVRATVKADGETIVYQETADDEVEAFADFLRFLLDHYGPSSNRYSAKRVHVIVKPGDKYEPPAQDGVEKRRAGKSAMVTKKRTFQSAS